MTHTNENPAQSPNADKVRCIVIDPSKPMGAQYREEYMRRDFREFCRLIGCDTFDVARTSGKSWTGRSDLASVPIDVYCDDEGLLKGEDGRSLPAILLPTGQALAGTIVLVSSDDEGETQSLPLWLTLELAIARTKTGNLRKKV